LAIALVVFLVSGASMYKKDRILSYSGAFSMPTKTSEDLTSSQLSSIGIVRKPKAKPETTPEREKYRPGDYTKFQQQLVDQALELKPESKPFSLPGKKNVDNFIERLIQAESSGRKDIVTVDTDGKKYTGLGQFGEARLTDYKKATGEKFSTDAFKNSRKLQMKVLKWHISDIDKQIELLGKEEGVDIKKFDRDGLRAVAHLGGLTGMREFVRTDMKYNKKDKNDTSLKDYYDRFSSDETVRGTI
jgi:hypothetical protein